MKELRFRAWHKKERRMYYRGYQKLLHVLLCEDDRGAGEGRGRPVKRASYEDVELLEGTAFHDKNRQEVFEGDIVRVRHKGRMFEGVVDYVPDMFGSKAIHPLKSVLEKNGVLENPADLDVEVIGNRFENRDQDPLEN